MRGETEVGKSEQHSVAPKDLLRGLARWGHHAVHGCALKVVWGRTANAPVAQVVTLRPRPNFRAYNPRRAQTQARRVCQLLTDLQPPLAALLARGATVDDAIDIVSLAWDLERQVGIIRIDPARERSREAAVLEQAAAIVAKWEPALREKTRWVHIELGDGRRRHTYTYTFCSEFLPWLAESLRVLQAPAGRRAGREVLILVRVLEELLRRRGIAPVAQEIAAIPHAAWPKLYRPGEFEEAATARKLLARARRTITLAALERALTCLPSWHSPGHRRRIPVRGGGWIELVQVSKNVPANVPATPRIQAKPTPRQPPKKRKTPW
jgi:hypothetical protein